MTATLLKEMCSNVHIEPELQPVTNESLSGATTNSQDGARLDISANGVWGGTFEKTYFDVRIFNPHAPSNKNISLQACYGKHEKEKKRTYEQRIREIEHSRFTPLVLSTTAGMSKETAVIYNHLTLCSPRNGNHHIKHTVLATLPPWRLPSTVLHSSNQRCKILSLSQSIKANNNPLNSPK